RDVSARSVGDWAWGLACTSRSFANRRECTGARSGVSEIRRTVTRRHRSRTRFGLSSSGEGPREAVRAVWTQAIDELCAKMLIAGVELPDAWVADDGWHKCQGGAYRLNS